MLYILKHMLRPDERKYKTQAKNVKFTYSWWEVFVGNSFPNPKVTLRCKDFIAIVIAHLMQAWIQIFEFSKKDRDQVIRK